MRTFLVITLLLASAIGTPRAAPAQAPASDAALLAEAEAFMDRYARDLLAGDRQALIGRYDPRGAYLVGNGRKEFMPLDSIRALYQGRWEPPASFRWENLSYDVAGPDAVAVTGQFVWGSADGSPPVQASYTSLLLRRDGSLLIRIEDESVAPRPCPAPSGG